MKKDLYTVQLPSGSIEVAFSKLPTSIEDKDGSSIYDYSARLVEVFVKKSYDRSDEFIFTFELVY